MTSVTPATGTAAQEAPRRRGLAIPEAGALLLFFAGELVYFGLKSPYFFERENWFNILMAIAIYGVLAAPATLLLVAGQFDLSVGSGVAFVAVMMAYIAGQQPPSLGHSLLLGVVVAVACGIGIGIVNGFFVTVVGINALITTLGMLAVLRGLAQVTASGQTVLLDSFSGLGQGRIAGAPARGPRTIAWLAIRQFFTIPATWALIAALEGPQDCVAHMRREYDARRALVCDRLRAMPGIRMNVPDGAFYAFFDVSAYFGRTLAGRTVTDSLGFCSACLESAHVNLVPGSAFGCEGFVRMSYAASREQLTGGLDRLESWLAGRP